MLGKVLKRVEDEAEFEKEEYGFIVSAILRANYSQVERRQIHQEIKSVILAEDNQLWKALGFMAENFQFIIYHDYQK